MNLLEVEQVGAKEESGVNLIRVGIEVLVHTESSILQVVSCVCFAVKVPEHPVTFDPLILQLDQR